MKNISFHFKILPGKIETNKNLKNPIFNHIKLDFNEFNNEKNPYNKVSVNKSLKKFNKTQYSTEVYVTSKYCKQKFMRKIEIF